jgi:hypothetical protein
VGEEWLGTVSWIRVAGRGVGRDVGRFSFFAPITGELR